MTTDDLIRIKCFESQSFFTRYFFKERQNRKFIVGEHHDIIFNKLHEIESGNNTRVIFNIAPRYGKTEIIVKNFIARSLAINPKAKFIHLSYSDQLALDNSEEIKDLVKSEEYQRLFPYVQIKKDSKAKNKWYTTEGGGVLARSSSGQVTGFGAGTIDEEDDDFNSFEFGGAIIIDDPLKPDDANSNKIRERVNNKFETTIRNRVNSRNTPIIIVMQRLHTDDLCGYLQEIEKDVWDVVSLPVIKQDGTPLWLFKHTIEELNHLKTISEYVFETQYMQNPQPKIGLLFNKQKLNYFTELPKEEPIAKLAFIDPADSGRDAHSVPVGYLYPNGSCYIEEVVYTTEPVESNVQQTADILNKHIPQYTRVEINMGGGMYPMLLEPKLDKRIMLLKVREKSSKHERIYTASGFIKRFCYFRSDYAHGSQYYEFMKILCNYLADGSADHDDAPDSLAGLVTMINQFYPNLYQGK